MKNSVARAIVLTMTLVSCAEDTSPEVPKPATTPIEVVRAFLIESVQHELPATGEWDPEMAEAFQTAVLALQIHPVWGAGCEFRLGHQPGVFTAGFGVHLRGVIEQYPGEEASEELARVLDAVDELQLAAPDPPPRALSTAMQNYWSGAGRYRGLIGPKGASSGAGEGLSKYGAWFGDSADADASGQQPKPALSPLFARATQQVLSGNAVDEPGARGEWASLTPAKDAIAALGNAPTKRASETTLDINGNSYVGSVLDGRPHGQGSLTWPDGTTYVGEFFGGVMHGQGVKEWSGGARYEGAWREGKLNGRGTLTWPGGSKYEGEFVDDKLHGTGAYTDASGKQLEGQFLFDKYVGEHLLAPNSERPANDGG